MAAAAAVEAEVLQRLRCVVDGDLCRNRPPVTVRVQCSRQVRPKQIDV